MRYWGIHHVHWNRKLGELTECVELWMRNGQPTGSTCRISPDSRVLV